MPQQLFGGLHPRLQAGATNTGLPAGFPSPSPLASFAANPFISSFQAAAAVQHVQALSAAQNSMAHASQKIHSRTHEQVEDESSDGDQGDEPKAVLENKGLWDSFAAIGTEMVITKTGR